MLEEKNCYYVNGRSRNDLGYSQAQRGRHNITYLYTRAHGRGGINNNSNSNTSRYTQCTKIIHYYIIIGGILLVCILYSRENFAIENELNK